MSCNHLTQPMQYPQKDKPVEVHKNIYYFIKCEEYIEIKP